MPITEQGHVDLIRHAHLSPVQGELDRRTVDCRLKVDDRRKQYAVKLKSLY